MADRLTKEAVVDVARALLDAGGLPALGMRRIATELGVQPSALYWHFENKQALLAALADDIVAGVEPTTRGDWHARVVALCLRLRAALLAHRDGAELVSTAIAFRLGADAITEMLDAELAAAGATPARRATASAVLLHYLLGATNDEQQQRQAAALGVIDAPPDDRTSNDRFVRGVELILAGLTTTSSSPAKRRGRATSASR